VFVVLYWLFCPCVIATFPHACYANDVVMFG
jgi:hypothetical protein